MKKHVLLLAAALTTIGLGLQGCGGKEASAPTTAAATEAETTTAAETTAEETTEEETTEAAKPADTATGIPSEYEAYLDWTADDWAAASDEEKSEAVVAYVLYDGIVYQGITDLTPEMVKEEPELDQLYAIVEAGISSSGGSTLKEICDLGHSSRISLDDLDLDADVVEKLQCDAEKWATLDDAGKKDVVVAMLLAVGKMTGQEITMEMIDTLSDAEIQGQISTVDSMFSSGLYDDNMSLYDMLSEQ